MQYMNIVMIVAMIALMYFLIYRPQAKRNQEFKNLQNSLKEGDRVVTFSGIYGDIVELGTSTIKLRIAPKVEIEIDRNAVRAIDVK